MKYTLWWIPAGHKKPIPNNAYNQWWKSREDVERTIKIWSKDIDKFSNQLANIVAIEEVKE